MTKKSDHKVKQGRISAVQKFIGRFDTVVSINAVDEFLRDGTLLLDTKEKVAYLNGGIWGSDQPRSLGRRSHGWFHLRYWHSAWRDLDEIQKQFIGNKFPEMLEAWSRAAQDPDTMAFHDETTAQRVINMTVFLHVAEPDLGLEIVGPLRAILRRDIDLLRSEDFYAGVNNHGMFQDIALLVAAAYGEIQPDPIVAEELAFARLVTYFSATFTQEGIHRENTPTYHLMVSRYLRMVWELALEQERDGALHSLQEVLAEADLYAAFALTPFGTFVPVSDTTLNQISSAAARGAFGEGYLLGAVTLGKSGKLPARYTYVAEKSGYAIYRDGWSDPESARHLYFHAAYNGDYHKHSDELSLYVAANGRALLSEAGANGYEYSDPFTQYAFSSFAHNTLIVDGEGLPRIDKKAALTSLEDLGSSHEKLEVRGRTRRFSGVDWQRSISVDPGADGAPIRIRDVVESAVEHEYTFLWHLGEKVIPLVRGNAIELFDEESHLKIGELIWRGSATAEVRSRHGERHPKVQGWTFPAMGKRIKTHTIEISLRNSSVEIEWEMRTRDFLLKDRGITPFNEEWRTFEGEKPVHYLLDLPEGKSPDKLAIVFSAMGQLWDFTYNYRSSMRDFPGAVLYIIDDFGDQGSYFLGNGREYAEFRSIQGLIRTVLAQLNLSTSQTIALGSSKGGAGAILHSVTAGLRAVYAGGPQYRIGNFVKTPHPNVLRYIAGGVSDSDIAWMNAVSKKILMSGVKSTMINVVVGKKDGHYRHHAVPLVDDARSMGYEVSFLAVPGTPHNELGSAFRKFIASLCIAEDPETEFMVPIAAGVDRDNRQIGLGVVLEQGTRAMAQLYKGRDKIGKLVQMPKGQVTFDLDAAGTYKARIYIEDGENKERKAFGTSFPRLEF